MEGLGVARAWTLCNDTRARELAEPLRHRGSGSNQRNAGEKGPSDAEVASDSANHIEEALGVFSTV